MKHFAMEADPSLLIDGTWLAGGGSMAVTNPWSGKLLGRVSCATAEHARAAVASAVAGLEQMRGLSTGERARILFRERMVAGARALRTGDPMDSMTDIGPMIDEAQAERLVQWTLEAQAAGARVLVGGARDGAVFEPTLLENVPEDARLNCQEAFGPVASLFAFSDLAAAIDAANSADFAIHAAIFTQSISTAHRAARHLKAAGVMINDSTDYRLDAMPFGGAGRGNMGREGVRFAAREMSQTKVVCFNEA